MFCPWGFCTPYQRMLYTWALGIFLTWLLSTTEVYYVSAENWTCLFSHQFSFHSTKRSLKCLLLFYISVFRYISLYCVYVRDKWYFVNKICCLNFINGTLQLILLEFDWVFQFSAFVRVGLFVGLGRICCDFGFGGFFVLAFVSHVFINFTYHTVKTPAGLERSLNPGAFYSLYLSFIEQVNSIIKLQQIFFSFRKNYFRCW